MAADCPDAHQKTIGADKNYDTHQGYAKSINAGRCIEKVFGWIKQFGNLRHPLRQERSPLGLTHPPGGLTDDHEIDL